MEFVVKISRCSGCDFRACCPALPGCVAYGRSQTEVSERIQDAIRGYVASLDAVLPRELARIAAIETS